MKEHEIDEWIRQAGKETLSPEFTSEVMESIRIVPLPGSSSGSVFPVWFKVFMIVVFTGALLAALFFGGNDAPAYNLHSEGLFRGMKLVSSFFTDTLTWMNLHIWIIPSVIFIVAGILFLLTERPEYQHQYE